jgi:hypothetical protein
MDVIFELFDALLIGLTKTYGLDWLTMCFGVIGAYYIANKDKRGIAFNILSCCTSFALATISHQYGFIIYNMIFAVMMWRAYSNWSREAKAIAN